jgi:hypothetical protein
MTPYATPARRVGEVVVAGLMSLGAIASSGCGARSGDSETGFWDQHIRVMDAARARGDLHAAETARQTAYLAALRSERWDAMAAVGDASARVTEDFPGLRSTLRPELRRIYGTALLRAHREGSLDGVLRVSEALADLGDQEAARAGLALAAEMLATSQRTGDGERVKELAERLDLQPSLAHDSIDEATAPAAATATWTR